VATVGGSGLGRVAGRGGDGGRREPEKASMSPPERFRHFPGLRIAVRPRAYRPV